MDSSVSSTQLNFSNSEQTKFGVHYIELAEDVSYEQSVGKFYVSYITPNIKTDSTFDTKMPKNGISNVLNKDDANKLGVKQITNSNYVSVNIPKHLFYITNITVVHPVNDSGEVSPPTVTIERQKFTKGTKFLAVNANGVFNDIQIIGVVENG